MITKTNSQLVQTFPQYAYGGWYQGEPKAKVTGADLDLYRNGTITSGLGRRRDNYCLHDVSYSFPIPEAGEFVFLEPVPEVDRGLVHHFVYGGSFADWCWHVSSYGFPPIPTRQSLESQAPMEGFEEFVQRQMDRFSRATGADLDLPTSLFELRDVKRVWEQVRTLSQHAERVARAPKRVRELLSRKTLRELTGSHLAYVFGIRPMISDYNALHKGLTGAWKDGYQKLLSSLDKPKRVYGSKIMEWTTPPVWNDRLGYVPLVGWEWRFRALQTITNPGNRPYSYNQYLRTKMGFDRPFTTLWNCLPFSFVVDWFADVGRAIDRFSKNQDQLVSNLSQVCCSRKTTTSVYLYARPRTGQYIIDQIAYIGNTYGSPVLLGRRLWRSYERFPHAVSAPPVTLSSNWRLNIASGASLAIAQVLAALPKLSKGPRRMAWSSVTREGLNPHGDIWR